MAKVLISLIGTGKQASGDNSNNKYETTDYILENKLYKDMTFTSNAIIQHFNIDKVYFIGTNKSMWDNLVEKFGGDEEYQFEILDWAKAFEELDRFASLDRLVKLSTNKLPKNAYSLLERMEEAFNIANMSAIYKEIQRLKSYIQYFKENENNIIRLLSPRFEEFINRFDKK